MQSRKPMIKFTTSQKIFAAAVIILTSFFSYVLYANLSVGEYSRIFLIVLAYFLTVFTTGLITGYYDNSECNSSELGFRYHLISFVCVNMIALPWLLLVMGFTWQSVLVGIGQITAWGTGLFSHWLFLRYRIQFVRN